MARKKKQKVEEASAVEQVSAPAEDKPVEAKPEVKAEKPAKKAVKEAQPVKITLEDACRRFIVGYKEHWFPSIKRFAEGQGYVGPTSEETLRHILKLWGAKLN